MTLRVKTILQAPEGVEESIIEGVPYYVNEDSQIESYSQDHVKILERHGYKKVKDETVGRPNSAPSRQQPPIDVEDFGRSQLAEALTERGISFPAAATRTELVDIAENWNARRSAAKVAATQSSQPAPRQQTPAAKSQPASVAPPSPQAPRQEAATLDEQDFDTLTHSELKGYLAARGVAFQGNSSRQVLADVAKRWAAEKKTAEVENEAV
jgi:hypothetical protein